jgi:FMN phosphatase YigB (HAD superfamily)
MSYPNVGSIFFDIDDTLANITVEESENKLVFAVLPGVISVLTKLRDDSIPIGILSDTPDSFTQETIDRSLEDAGLFDFFLPELLIYSSVIGLKTNSMMIFYFAALRAGFPHERHKCLFVGGNAMERQLAKAANFQVFEKPDRVLNLTII